MKVITIKQPWATLIAEGYKEYEFRSWKTKYRGEILIHAGKGIDRKAVSRFENLHLQYPQGCIIAKAEITDCVLVDAKFRKEIVPKNPEVYRELIEEEVREEYGFKIENVQPLKPIEVNGKLGLWEYDYEK